MTGGPRFLTCAEVAERWRVSPREVQKLAARGELTHVRLGRAIRIPERVVVEFERSRTVRAG